MPTTTRTFSSLVDLPTLIAIAESIGAHIAAKLQEFGSDERTLTEELCDMLCIWAKSSTTPGFVLTLNKISQREEAKIGADLEIIVETPSGRKRALMQAKVLDPDSLLLRCDNKEGWAKLRKQLKQIRAHANDLSFLLLYVPGAELDGSTFDFGTWEQGYLTKFTAGTSSQFGVTLIPVDLLLSDKDRWKRRPGVKYLGAGLFAPNGISFSQFFLELLSCKRGSWLSVSDAEPIETQQPIARLTLVASISQISLNEWSEVMQSIRQRLESEQNMRQE